MILDVSTQEGERGYLVGRVALVSTLSLHASGLRTIHQLLTGIGGGTWLDEATIQAQAEMDNCTKKAIREAEAELDKAYDTMKSCPYHMRILYKISIVVGIWKTKIFKR